MSMDRRHFIRGGLTASASVLLTPLLKHWIAHAQGEMQTPRRVVFIVEGCGMNVERFTPGGLPDDMGDGVFSTEQFQLSPMMHALQPWQDRLLLIDGLSNDQGLAGSGHSTGYAALSCVPNDPPNEVGRPGGETLDIFLSRTMGSMTLFPHVHLGVGRTFSPRIAAISANEMRQPIPMFCEPTDAYQQLFGAALEQDGGAGGQRSELVMGLVRGDTERLRRRLGAEERIKLDQVLNSIETLERRRQQIRMRAEEIRACAPDAPGPSDTIEDRIEGHFAVATSALICGLSKVVTIASGCGYNFFDVPYTRLGLEGTKHQMGHGYVSGLDGLDLIHNFHAEQIATLCASLASVQEGEGTMLDHTLIIWTNENGEAHHATYRSWPVVMIGGPRLGLNSGRYVRYPDKGTVGARTLADLWNTVCHLMGVPRNDFGRRGREIVTGPIDLSV